MTELTMPSYGISEAGGLVLKWLRAEGERVEKGEPLVEVESEKAAVELEAPAAGVLARIVVQEGTQVDVGETLALIAEEGSSPPAKDARSGAETTAPHTAIPSATTSSAAGPGDPQRAEPSLKAAPSARRLARDHGVDLHTVKGTGPQGRIVYRDVQAALEATEIGTAQPSPAESAREELTPTRRVIAQRMAESARTVPHFYVSIDVDASGMLAAVAELGESGEKPSLTALLVRLVTDVLERWPRLNASWRESHIDVHPSVHMGVAVATGRGVLVPVIKNVNGKTVTEIDRELRALASRAREGRLGLADVSGGTFTVTNLGMYGVRQFNPIINPPQCAILAIGAVSQRPFAGEGCLGVRPEMTLTLAADHRVVDGAEAAAFLNALRERVEEHDDGRL
ncbi:MAG: 2-oxo acid dehydrogenase subunit E2 [Deinococcota bacterium]|nr:2-oxo acid dehydrogenase subunit E2 [Deinococcota bacterium]